VIILILVSASFYLALYVGYQNYNHGCNYRADVERLIGEGAVRTVKKPSQMKRRVFTAQPPTFYRKEEVDDETLTCNTSVNSKKSVIQEEDSRIEECNYETYQNYNDFSKVNSKSSDSVHTTVDEQSDITYLMMDDSFVNIGMYTKFDKCIK